MPHLKPAQTVSIFGLASALAGRFQGLAVCLVLVVLTGFPVLAQNSMPTPREVPRSHTWQVFMQQNVETGGIDRLIFLDVLSGEQKQVEVNGEHYTPAGNAIMFFDLLSRRVMVALPNGRVEPHPFILMDDQTRRVDWRMSDDGTMIAWTIVTGDAQNNLSTVTRIANLEGSEPRIVLEDGPRQGLRALPVAFSPDKAVLYMDYQPDGASALIAFPQYAGLFALDLESGEVLHLPGEPGCFCGAGFGAGLFLRLALTDDQRAFDVKVYNLAAQVEQTIPALRLGNYTQAGDFVIAPDGSRAVYALAQIRSFGMPEQAVRTVFVLVDLQSMRQAALTEPITTFVRPLAWTDDNTAVLFTSPQRDGTWKVNLSDGRLNKVAEAAYLGTISGQAN